MEAQERFVDGLGQIHFVNGMVRLDLYSAQVAGEGKEPTQQVVERLILPPQGFLTMLGGMQQLADKLVEAGILQKRENA